ncbi:AAA family ATPase [Zoogloea dura]|uniref:AAA family ATPase n=1 Tax=Zoogloea dura TaxID=2728840 RepID=A0A848G235_9RHOO|nr:AAA family ATPase [Zoogloea dura]NML25116.1 AAA family ATPase [Zoogloea dura]
MKLKRLRLEQFRRFRQPFQIDGLTPGLNLFTGPNEAGKSTLVAALRAAFFERYRSSAVDDLRPWGDSAAAPTVELDFELGGHDYRLTKSFLHKKRCELQWNGQQLDGTDAEDRLAELLGFQHAGKGASKAEHWGIPGLLWISQGSAQEIREPVAHATDHLRRALNTSLGEVAASGGDDLLANVEARRNELLTAAGGKPRGDYAAAREQEKALEDELASLDQDIAQYSQKVDRLARLRQEHTREGTEQTWVAFRAQEADARARLEALQGVERELAGTRQQQARGEERLRLLRSHLDAFEREEKELATRRAATAAAQHTLDEAAAALTHWQPRHDEAARRYDSARHALRLARQEDTRRNLVRSRDEQRRQAEAAGAALTQAEAAHAILQALRQQAAAGAIKDSELKTLRELGSQLTENRIRREASATRLGYTLDAGVRLTLDGQGLEGRGERHLFDHSQIDLPGLGRLEITPGGTGLAELQRAADELEDQRSALLQRLGLNSPEEAETRAEARRQLEADLRSAETGFKALAPKGLDALRLEHAQRTTGAAEAETSLAALAPPPEQPPPAVATAEAEEEAARQALAILDSQLATARLAESSARAAFAAATQEQASAQARLDDPARGQRLGAANAELTDARAEQDTLSRRVAALEQQIAEAHPDILRQDVERYRSSAGAAEARHRERATEIYRLEVELEAAGARGLDERRAEIDRDLAQARRRSAELARRAAALDHLLTLLRSHRQALTQRLQAPLQKHLARYLQLLFPRARLDIDENLGPGPLTRPGPQGDETGNLEALSFGAREQMGVITRLAYADLLREAGRPTLLVLDDALVHSDETRLAQMKRVLFDAAGRHQILLFTCHPEKWRDLGVAARTLDSTP